MKSRCSSANKPDSFHFRSRRLCDRMTAVDAIALRQMPGRLNHCVRRKGEHKTRRAIATLIEENIATVLTSQLPCHRQAKATAATGFPTRIKRVKEMFTVYRRWSGTAIFDHQFHAAQGFPLNAQARPPTRWSRFDSVA